jgi:hypothetical protein
LTPELKQHVDTCEELLQCPEAEDDESLLAMKPGCITTNWKQKRSSKE